MYNDWQKKHWKDMKHFLFFIEFLQAVHMLNQHILINAIWKWVLCVCGGEKQRLICWQQNNCAIEFMAQVARGAVHAAHPDVCI